jgi:hypothetical protein
MSSLLPVTIDNAYSGRKIGLWLLALVVLVKVLQMSRESWSSGRSAQERRLDPTSTGRSLS